MADDFVDQDMDDAQFYDAISVDGLKAYLAAEDLATVQSLEMRADSSQVTLSALGERLPNLMQLKLNNSTLSSLRDLGTAMPNLQVLWVSRCGLRDLEGASGFPQLKELYLAFNDVSDLSNSVSDLGQVQFLSGCDALNSLTLDGNPLAYSANYRANIFKLLPHIELLDDEPNTAAADAPETTAAELDQEAKFVHEGIKYARMGIDEALFDSETQLANLREFDAKDPYRPRTALPSASRPGSSAAGGRPGTAAAGAAALLGGRRPGSARFGSRPSTAAAAAGGRRPSTAGSQSADSRQQRTSQFGGSDGHDDDGSSDLTFGSADALCGNLTKALRGRRQQTGAKTTAKMTQRDRDGAGTAEMGLQDGCDSQSIASMRHSDLDLLHELRTWKLETAAMNTTGVGEANDSSHLGDSHWGNAGTITHKPNSDGTEANILRLDTGEDSGEDVGVDDEFDGTRAGAIDRRIDQLDAQVGAAANGGGGVTAAVHQQYEDGPVRWDRTASSEALSTVSSPSTTPDKETDMSRGTQLSSADHSCSVGVGGGSSSRMVARLRRSVDSVATDGQDD